MRRSPWIDVSMPLHNGMVHWPGDPAVRIKQTSDMARGGRCNLSALSMSAHTGTHMDAPFHFLPDGPKLDAMPIEATIGRGRVIEIRDPVSVKPQELGRHGIRKGERILFRTRNSTRCHESDAFIKNFVYISTDAAQFLVERGVRTVGVDYLSVGGYKRDSRETHTILLSAGIWIIEGMNLSRVRQGLYDLVCLPLRILNADGAPARAVLRKVAGM
jgi:arylformamidase